MQVPLTGLWLWGRPERESRTPVNTGNRPRRDNGEGVVPNHSLTH